MTDEINKTTRNILWGSSQNPVQRIVWRSIKIHLWNSVGHYIQNRTIHSASNFVFDSTKDYFKQK
jgi:hypothetical protein